MDKYGKMQSGTVKSFAMVWTLAFGLICSNGLHAQEPQVLTLTQAIDLALQENISLQKFSNTVYADRVDVNQAEANFLPNLNASISASKDYPKTGEGGKSLSGSLSSSLNLFNGFYDVSRLNSARLGWAADTSDYSWNRQGIIYGTVSQFVQVVLDSEFIRIARDNLQTQQDQLKQIEEFAKVGNRSKVDVFQQLTDLKQSELQYIQAKRDYQVSRYTLLQTLSKPADALLQFETLPVDTLLASIPEVSPRAATSEIVEKRQDVLAQRLQISAAQTQVKAAQSGYWPSVSLSASAGSNYSSGFSGFGFSDQFFDQNPNLRLGLSFSIPLFDRFSTRYSVQQAKIQLDNQQLNMRDLQLQIGTEVQQALLDYQTAVKQREAAHAQYEYADEALKIAEERFRVGSSTYVELSQVRANFYNAAYQKASADYNMLLRYIAVHYYSGTIDQAISIFS